jgi:hypothetical protein
VRQVTHQQIANFNALSDQSTNPSGLEASAMFPQSGTNWFMAQIIDRSYRLMTRFSCRGQAVEAEETARMTSQNPVQE